ncbi:acyltransferase [Candidatus Gottesmanbacteria bacterium]|nr:acyltransferase [Candidatus Gottesmanbacteria bacterium]
MFKILHDSLATPWKVSNEIFRVLIYPLVRFKFALSGAGWGKGWKIYGMPNLQITRGAKLSIGEGLQLRSWISSNPLGSNHPVIISIRRHNARITIGNKFGMSGGSIVSEKSIKIGNRVLVGANCIIIDSDFHPLDYQNRANPENSGKVLSVIIEDDVFIGMETIILKGTHIGARSVIGAGSVVSGKVPADVLAAGNPIKIIRKLDTASK